MDNITKTECRKARHLPTAIYAALGAAVAVLLVAPELYANSTGIARVTEVLDDANGEIQKWYISISAIATVLFTIIGVFVGIQWWEDRGRGKESAKGLIMGAFFGFAVMPWMLVMARGCSGTSP